MPTKARQVHRPLKGIAFMLLATLNFTASDSLGKLVAEHYSVPQATLLRCVLGMLFIGVYAAGRGQFYHFRIKRPAWHVLRGCVHVTLVLGLFYGLKMIPLAEVISIVFASPFIVALLSPLMLHEKVSRQSWTAIGIGFFGVLIIARPTPEHFHFAHLVVLISATCSSLLIITARRLADTESVITLNFFLYPIPILVTSLWAAQDWATPSFNDWLVFIAMALTSTLAVIFVTQAMHHARPAVVAPIDYLRLAWTPIIGYVFWGEVPGLLIWLGIGAIIISGVYIVRQGRMVPEVGVEGRGTRNED
jgi:drug/metabolite transporter (DMT)-like permease